jgi:O-acetyl-ADP-ribose deacetylase (regulator of RNase III)
MSQPHYTWTLGKLVFHLQHGDLFQAPVEAIVNSEQSDFLLDCGGRTISGQIHRRWGSQVQAELTQQTGGAVLPPGTVLTTGGDPYAAIFHAGFHHPGVFLDGETEDDQTEHLKLIRSCVRQVLDRAVDMPLRSVAFPLLGCGLFGLDPRLMASEFFEEVAHVAGSAGPRQETHVWLVIFRDNLFAAVLQAGVQAWLDLVPALPRGEPFDLGVPYLDLFEEQVLRAGGPQWSAWMTVRHAEVLAGYLLAVLASAPDPAVRPADLLEEDRQVTFGFLRMTLAGLAERVLGLPGVAPWPAFLARLVREDYRGGRRLEQINHARNDIAHGRGFRPAEALRRDLADFLRIEQWRALCRDHGPPPAEPAGGWLGLHPETTAADRRQRGSSLGFLERWNRDGWTYVVPGSGARFVLPGVGMA